MQKTVFVVLHYLNMDDTVHCIASLQKNCPCCPVVVVDNASPNGSGKALLDRYSGDEFVEIVLNARNDGFAEGNNIGYAVAKERYKADFIICINNDTAIEDPNFLCKVYRSYEKNQFAILGPDVYNPITQVHQSPIRARLLDRAGLEKEIMNVRKLQSIIRIKNLLAKLHLRAYGSPKQTADDNSMRVVSSDVVIHGACVIYSPVYIGKESTAFVPGTFMYYEEDLLKLYCQINGYKMLFDPSITICHFEGKSTNSSVKSNFERDLFKIKQNKKSLKIYQSMLEEAGLPDGNI